MWVAAWTQLVDQQQQQQQNKKKNEVNKNPCQAQDMSAVPFVKPSTTTTAAATTRTRNALGEGKFLVYKNFLPLTNVAAVNNDDDGC